MLIPDEQLIKFQELYKKHFGKDISKEEALEKGIQLMRLVSLTYKPMTEDELKLVQERQKAIAQTK